MRLKARIESGKPVKAAFSDQALTEAFRETGISVTRRTVAKYREEELDSPREAPEK